MALVLTITDAGRAALRNSDGTGTRAVRIAAVGVSAAPLAATTATAALPAEIKRITTLSGEAVAADIIHLVVRDETMATYAVRSFALYLDDGTLFAAYGQADAIIEKSAQALLLLAIDVTLADIAAIQVTFGDANFTMPPATDVRAGVIELATPAEAKAGADAVRAITPATAKAAVRDWIGYTPANIRGDQFSGPVEIRHANPSLALLVAQAGLGNGFIQLGDSGSALATRTWHLGAQGDGSFALYQGVWGTGTLRLHVTATTITYNGGAVWHANNDGAGSGLDADMLDGLHAAQLLRADQSSTLARDVAIDFVNAAGVGLRIGGNGYTSAGARASVVTTTGNLHLDASAGSRVYLNHYAGDGVVFSNGAGGIVATMSKAGALAAAAVDAPVVNRSGVALAGFDNDGSGSGLDADMVDGLHAAQLLRADQSSTLARDAALDFVNTAGVGLRIGGNGYTAAGARASVVTTTGNLHLDATTGSRVYLNHYAGDGVSFGNGAGGIVATMSKGGALTAAAVDAPVVNRSGLALAGFDNDGAGSGLDADLLDGRQGSEYAALVGAAFTGTVAAPVLLAEGGDGRLVLRNRGAPGDDAHGWTIRSEGDVLRFLSPNGLQATLHPFAGFNTAGAITQAGSQVYHVGNDGAGSGMDADLLDGRDAGSFANAAHTHTAADLAGAFTGSLTENGYTVLPNGLILQWATGPMQPAKSSAATYVQWPIVFPAACLQVFVSTQTESASDRGDSWYQLVGAPGPGGATIQRQASGTADDIIASAPRIFAIGM